MSTRDASAAAALMNLRFFVGDAETSAARMKAELRRAKKNAAAARRRAKQRQERDARRKLALDAATLLPAPQPQEVSSIRGDGQVLLSLTNTPPPVPAVESNWLVPSIHYSPDYSVKTLRAICSVSRCKRSWGVKKCVRFSDPLVTGVDEPILESMASDSRFSAVKSSPEQLAALRQQLKNVDVNDALIWNVDKLRSCIRYLACVGNLTYKRLPVSQPQMWAALKSIQTCFGG